MKISLISAVFALVAGMSCATASAKTFRFPGYDWEVRPSENSGGPGPNHWDENNAWVDKDGALHLRITQRDGKWYCAEVYTTKAFKFGTYQFWVEGRVDKLDQNVVLGLFNYPESDIGPDGTNEMDIEFARWGKASAQPGNYTVYPSEIKLGQETRDFPISLQDVGLSTQRFSWSATSVLFQSLHGHCDDNSNLIHDWLYQPADPAKHISQSAMPVHINLWLFDGKPPRDGQTVEVVIRAFKFIAK